MDCPVLKRRCDDCEKYCELERRKEVERAVAKSGIIDRLERTYGAKAFRHRKHQRWDKN